MQWVLRDDNGDFVLQGEFVVSSSDDRETSFKLLDKSKATGVPVEVVEVFYDDPKEAVNDLLRGDIDVLDQVYPADAKQLANDPRLRISSYSLPSTHMLIPVSDDPFLGSAKFRRALMFATNRKAMLQGEILNSEDEKDGRLISGPFPIGDGRNDLLAYAYDPEIPPIDYSPPLARLLVVMAEDEVRNAAARKREPEPKRRKLVVGCPDYEFARVAVQGMIQQWSSIGVEAEVEILPPGRLTKDGVELDLLYVVAALWEPVSDIERLLGSDGVASTDDPYVVQGLEELRNASNWREVRDALQKLHQLVDYHLPVMPLWQVKDQFVVNKYVEGIRGEPLSLYESISRWRINQSQGN
jgi:ABC-type transport system substrate-binding protein